MILNDNEGNRIHLDDAGKEHTVHQITKIVDERTASIEWCEHGYSLTIMGDDLTFEMAMAIAETYLSKEV